MPGEKHTTEVGLEKPDPMAMGRPRLGTFEEEDKKGSNISGLGSIYNTVTNAPVFISGSLAGAFGIILYRIYNYKKRPSYEITSDYVLKTRVMAQGFFVFSISICFIPLMRERYLKSEEAKKKRMEARALKKELLASSKLKDKDKKRTES